MRGIKETVISRTVLRTPYKNLLEPRRLWLRFWQEEGFGDGAAASFINTELAGMTPMDTSMNVGPSTVRIGSDNRVQPGASLGQIPKVLTTTPGSAALVASEAFASGNCFLDVFFEVNVGGVTMNDRVPYVLTTFEINALSPVLSAKTPAGTIQLFFRQGANSILTDSQVFNASGWSLLQKLVAELN